MIVFYNEKILAIFNSNEYKAYKFLSNKYFFEYH